jgi:hypothetical protein
MKIDLYILKMGFSTQIYNLFRCLQKLSWSLDGYLMVNLHILTTFLLEYTRNTRALDSKQGALKAININDVYSCHCQESGYINLNMQNTH